MLKIDVERRFSWAVLRVRARISGNAVLALALGFLFSIGSNYAQAGSEIVDFDIPALTLLRALLAFARQVRVELVFADRGFDAVRTRFVVGAHRKARALRLLLAGTGLRVGYGSGDSVIVQRVGHDTAGFATVAEVGVGAVSAIPGGMSVDLRSLGAGSTLVFLNGRRTEVGAGAVWATAGGASVDLRCLGADSTLVFLNGGRMAPGGQDSNFTNIASIPSTAIERVGVTTDGASAIDGSDGIGGVVNFIPHDDSAGAETRLCCGSD